MLWLSRGVRNGMAALPIAAGILLCSSAVADVFVLANRTRQPVDLRISPESAAPYDLRLTAGEVRPLFSDERLQLAFGGGDERNSHLLDANSVYYFGLTPRGSVGVQKVGLGGDESTRRGRRLPGKPGPDPPAVVTVRLLVDDDEPMRRGIWEKKLRDRVARASEILIRHAGVGLRVVGVGEWVSSNDKTDFTESLLEFEKRVDPGPARLAIGFTSQYEVARGRIHLGGTRGPLRRHIMIREWSSRVTEPERLELLVHELGHFLAASHSPEQDSVMRPVLGDKQALRREFAIRYDPVNTLIIAMIGEELRRRDVQRFSQLTAGTRKRLGQVYRVLGQTMPDDPSAQRFVALTNSADRSGGGDPTSRVLRAVVAAARANRGPGGRRLAGEELTTLYVRAAATAADRLPPEQGPRAFLLALGIAIDDGAALRKLPLTSGAVARAESTGARRARLAVLGDPSVGGRRDLAKHFFVSAHLTAAADAAAADRLGLTKEMLDSQGGSGFSFADVAANRAGIRFATQVLAGKIRLKRIAAAFTPDVFMPPTGGMPEGLASDELIERFGGVGDERYENQLSEVDRRINALPAYTPIKLDF